MERYARPEWECARPRLAKSPNHNILSLPAGAWSIIAITLLLSHWIQLRLYLLLLILSRTRSLYGSGKHYFFTLNTTTLDVAINFGVFMLQKITARAADKPIQSHAEIPPFRLIFIYTIEFTFLLIFYIYHIHVDLLCNNFER